MDPTKSPHKGGQDAFRMRHSTTPSIEPPYDPFAGSLEEQVRRLWELRPAVSSAAGTESPSRRRCYMQLRKLVYASRYDLPTLPERIATFAAKNDLPMTGVFQAAQAIMTEWQGASWGVQL